MMNSFVDFDLSTFAKKFNLDVTSDSDPDMWSMGHNIKVGLEYLLSLGLEVQTINAIMTIVSSSFITLTRDAMHRLDGMFSQHELQDLVESCEITEEVNFDCKGRLVEDFESHISSCTGINEISRMRKTLEKLHALSNVEAGVLAISLYESSEFGLPMVVKPKTETLLN